MAQGVWSALALLIVSLLIRSACCTCYANPGVRNPEAIGLSTMATCCWMHEDTCCAKNGLAANLSDIQASLKQLVQNGVSAQCYLALANLECIVCDPTQTTVMQPQGLVSGGVESNLEDQVFTLRVCSTLAKQIYAACSDASSTAALGTSTASLSYIDFVQGINGSLLTANPADVSAIFFSAQFVVTDFDCYYGSYPSSVAADLGVCLYTYNECLIPDQPYQPAPAPALLPLLGALGGALLLAL